LNNGIVSTGTLDSSATQAVVHGGTCSNNNACDPNDYTGGLELAINSTQTIIASYSKAQNSNDWNVVLTKPFFVDATPANTVANATTAGLSTSNALTYRYTAYSDNSCLVGPGTNTTTYNCDSFNPQALYGDALTYCRQQNKNFNYTCGSWGDPLMTTGGAKQCYTYASCNTENNACGGCKPETPKFLSPLNSSCYICNQVS
jgi:hypothetical protein